MDDIDRLLSTDDSPAPPAGFTARVMTAVDASATEEPALPLPWGRIMLGLGASGASAMSIVSVLSSAETRATLQAAVRVHGVAEALLAAAVSLAVAQAFRLRAQADL